VELCKDGIPGGKNFGTKAREKESPGMIFDACGFDNFA
jgi:hypothetical protein